MGLIDDIQQMRDEARAEMNRLLPEFRSLRDDFAKTRTTLDKLIVAVNNNTKALKERR